MAFIPMMLGTQLECENTLGAAFPTALKHSLVSLIESGNELIVVIILRYTFYSG